MNERLTDDLQIEDLSVRAVDSRDAEQVRGGLNPQPLPPRYRLYQPPVYQPPVYNPVLVRG